MLGLQSLMKDLAVGIIMMFEDTFHLGDEVEVAGVSGQVEEITLRVLKIRDSEGALVSIPFNKIDVVINCNREYITCVFKLYFGVECEPKVIQSVMEESFKELVASGKFSKKTFKGNIKVFGPIKIDINGQFFEGKVNILPMSPKPIYAAYYEICRAKFDHLRIRFKSAELDFGNLFK
jgi:small conductance mechanosensitive channel